MIDNEWPNDPEECARLIAAELGVPVTLEDNQGSREIGPGLPADENNDTKRGE